MKTKVLISMQINYRWKMKICLAIALMMALGSQEIIAQVETGYGWCQAHGNFQTYAGGGCPKCASGGGYSSGSGYTLPPGTTSIWEDIARARRNKAARQAAEQAAQQKAQQSADDTARQAALAAQRAERARQVERDASNANERGNACYKKGEWAKALKYYREAESKSPNNRAIRTNITLVQDQQAQEANEKLAIARDQVAATKMQETIRNYAKSHKSASTTTASTSKAEALEFGDPGSLGAFGSKESNAKFPTAPTGTVGTDTNAGNQLKSVEHHSGIAKNLSPESSSDEAQMGFDKSGHKAGSLVPAHTLSAGPPPMDLSGFSERAKKDPQIVSSLNSLSGLQSKRIQLDAQREKLIKERNQEKNPAIQQEKTQLVDQIDKSYQTNLAAISEVTQKIETRKLFIDTSGGEVAPNPTGPETK